MKYLTFKSNNKTKKITLLDLIATRLNCLNCRGANPLRHNKRFAYLFIWLLFFSFSTQSLLLSQNLRDLRILHINDTHATNIPFQVNNKEVPEIPDSIMMVGGAAYLKAYVDKNRDLNTIFLGAGDYAQGSPASSITKGKSQIEILNYMALDAVTLGNHEFDYSTDTLLHFLKDSRYKMINCNLVEKVTGKLLFDPYKIITKNEVKVAIIGVMSEDLPELVIKGAVSEIDVLEIIPTVKKYIAKIKELEKPNLILLLSHAGYFVDQQIAEAIPELDIIVGGHTHTRIPHPAKHNRTIICQAGEKSKYLGVLDLKVDVDNDSVYSFLGKLVPIITDYIQPDTIVARIVDSIDTECLKGFNEIIGELKNDWVRRYNQESNIGNWITDMILDFSQADVAFYNSGGIRKNLNAGPISIKDVWEITPFENSVVYFYIRGDSLYNLFEFQVSDSAQRLQIAGAEYKYNLNNPKGKRIVDLKINKQEILPFKIYKVATNNFVFSQPIKHFGFDLEPTQMTDCEVYVRDLFISYVRKQKVIDSKIENRIVQVY